MFADTIEELHQVAAQLDLKRQWFQDPTKKGGTSMPHYDLAPSKRALAIELGAVELSLMESGQMIRDYKRRAKAKVLTALIKIKAPGYRVEWNPDVKIWPDSIPGAFEIYGATGNVHYRRTDPAQVLELINQ